MIGELHSAPPESGTRGRKDTLGERYAADAEVLKANPGQWALLENKNHRPAIKTIQLALNGGIEDLTLLDWEVRIISVRTALSDDASKITYDIWVSYKAQ